MVFKLQLNFHEICLKLSPFNHADRFQSFFFFLKPGSTRVYDFREQIHTVHYGGKQFFLFSILSFILHLAFIINMLKNKLLMYNFFFQSA